VLISFTGAIIFGALCSNIRSIVIKNIRSIVIK